MSSVNRAILIGNLGKDPEVRNTQSGDMIVGFSLATSETWKDKASGERRERAEWHRVQIFNQALAKVAQQYLRKGSKVYVEGQIQTRKWTDRNGTERYTTEIILPKFGGALVMLSGKSDDGGSSSDDAPAPAGGGELDDDIPF